MAASFNMIARKSKMKAQRFFSGGYWSWLVLLFYFTLYHVNTSVHQHRSLARRRYDLGRNETRSSRKISNQSALVARIRAEQERSKEEARLRPRRELLRILFSARSALVRNLDARNLTHDVRTAKKRIESLSLYIDVFRENGGGREKLIEAKLKRTRSQVDSFDNAAKECGLSDLTRHPNCATEYNRMQVTWKHALCRASFKLDGSRCAIVRYLIGTGVCPGPARVRRRKRPMPVTGDRGALAEAQTDFEYVYEQLLNRSTHWMMARIVLMEGEWVDAGKQLMKNGYRAQRRRILLAPSALLEGDGESDRPVDRLDQWSDLFAALHVIGHDVTLCTSPQQLRQLMAPKSCPSLTSDRFDIVFTDVVGAEIVESMFNSFSRSFHEEDGFARLRCKLRVLSRFGTDPEFNVASKMEGSDDSSPSESHFAYGRMELNPKQFLTMFPQSPDNTFLGFAVSQARRSDRTGKQNMSLVHGTGTAFWSNRRAFIDLIRETGEVHATFQNDSKSYVFAPHYVIDHGVLAIDRFQELLDRSRIFVGLGYPFESPAAVEAVARGCVFLNPRIATDKDLVHEAEGYFHTKATRRTMRTQHDYLMQRVGAPHVITVDIGDSERVKRALRNITSGKRVTPRLPREFTVAGMLERVFVLVDKQDFCRRATPQWPPERALRVVVAAPTEDCARACENKGLVCEPAFFPAVNEPKVFAFMGVKCERVVRPERGHARKEYPAHYGSSCILQTEPLLFSCVGEFSFGGRVCPCRDFLPGQIALCKDCLPW